ncbi:MULTISPECIES: hypothetical protein [unclassified Beijerinckia]|uniref:Pam3-gp28 family putative phage holin n=1 Tax=unclassified Beijerinckia TaxID=2638183 RepID=UPI0008969B67|nr:MULTISPECIES: hypothetical protein [unclassified Beijerinckia]MDH7794139.1 hypothetical protein [Beijerinckia sp. GAS462]SEB54156.1 hypothetical protein SAMN05443249_0404 [Beijerinckia sp. 28-YEA-48]
MTQDQFLAVLRQLLSFAGGFAVARGWLTNEQLTAVAGLVPPLVAIWWVWRRSSPGGQIAAVAANPDVSQIVAKAEVANASPSVKVVPQ